MKRMILLLVALVIGFVANSQARRGTYYNTNSTTNQITKAVIIKNGSNGAHYIRLYAKCRPKDCYWGQFKLERFPDLYERIRSLPDGYTWLPYYSPILIDKGFVRKHIAISSNIRNKDHIRINVYTDFRDPKRKDTKIRNILKLK